WIGGIGSGPRPKSASRGRGSAMSRPACSPYFSRSRRLSVIWQSSSGCSNRANDDAALLAAGRAEGVRARDIEAPATSPRDEPATALEGADVAVLAVARPECVADFRDHGCGGRVVELDGDRRGIRVDPSHIA